MAALSFEINTGKLNNIFSLKENMPEIPKVDKMCDKNDLWHFYNKIKWQAMFLQPSVGH